MAQLFETVLLDGLGLGALQRLAVTGGPRQQEAAGLGLSLLLGELQLRRLVVALEPLGVRLTGENVAGVDDRSRRRGDRRAGSVSSVADQSDSTFMDSNDGELARERFLRLTFGLFTKSANLLEPEGEAVHGDTTVIGGRGHELRNVLPTGARRRQPRGAAAHLNTPNVSGNDTIASPGRGTDYELQRTTHSGGKENRRMNPSDRITHIEQTAHYKLPGSTRVLVSRELRRLARVLTPDERLLSLAQGRMAEVTGLIGLTDKRLVFIGRQLMIEERVLHAAQSEYTFAELQTVQGEQRALSGSLILHLSCGRTQITDVNPPERATEIAALARARIQAERNDRPSPDTRDLAPAEPAHQKADMLYTTA